MELPPKPLTTRETVLLITHAAGDEVGGRTIMQKLAYFAGLGLNTGLGHRPHFYGPFSSKVEDAVSNAVLAGDLHEVVERMPHWSGGPDLRKYTYTLTASGKDRVDELIEHRGSEWERVRESVKAIKAVLPTMDQKTLSSAAKTYLIVSESSGGVKEVDIPGLAKNLGWDLDLEQTKNTVALLRKLGLLLDGVEQSS